MAQNNDTQTPLSRSGIALKLNTSPSPPSSNMAKAESSRRWSSSDEQLQMAEKRNSPTEALEGETRSSADSSPVEDWDPAYFTKLTSLCYSDMSDDEILQLPSKQVNDVKLMQLRLTLDIQPLLDKYNSMHDDQLLGPKTVKKRFTEAFVDVAERNDVPLRDLKKAYNKITKATKTRMREKREDSAKPEGISKKPAKPKAEPVKSTCSKGKAPKSFVLKGPKAEIIGAPEERNELLVEKSEGEILADKRFAEVLATKGEEMIIPRLPLYHAIIRVLRDKKEVNHLNLDDLKDIRKLWGCYTVEAVVLSINSWIPGCATEEQVQEVYDQALAEIPKRTDYGAAAYKAMYAYEDAEVIPP